MTKPLILMCVLLLTVIALGVGYMVFRSESDRSSARSKAMTECINRNIMRSDIDNLTQYCRDRA
jgi:hypothetical protein